MNKLRNVIASIIICFPILLIAQNTVGLISYNPTKAYDGYNLLYPHNQSDVFLLDNCGEIVHIWEGDEDTRPANTAYLREDGRIIKTVRSANITQDAIWAGGGGAIVEIRDWDNNLEWSYTLNDSMSRLHHDITLIEKPNNEFNVMMIAWEVRGLDELIAVGRDTTVLEGSELWPDFILEIDPATDEIVWEWHAWDHLIQDRDSTLSNFGVISDNPGKIDVNLDLDGLGDPDWMHCNSIDFDPINDYVILSVPNFHEVWFIDHTTTTEEAAQSFGGFSGKGGDLMYRWGNPASYKAGTAEDQKLFFQHDVNLMNDFIDVFDPNYGKILLFNNRRTEDASSVNIFDPRFDMYEWSFPFSDGVYGPDDYTFDFFYPEDPTRMFSTGLSSAQYLPNGNFLIDVGRFGYTFEVTPDNEIVWEYITPRIGQIPATQGDTLAINQNLTFRMDRYPADFGAFEGRDLVSQGWIELEPNMEFCDQILPTIELFEKYGLELYPNPAQDMITIEWNQGMYVNIEIFNMQGQAMIESQRVNGGRKYFDTSQWVDGIYVVRIDQKEAGKFLITR